MNQIQFFLSPLEIDVGFRASVHILSPDAVGLELNNMATKNTDKSTQTNETTGEGMMPSLLVGYVRRSNAGGAIKVSINTNAFGDCETYTTSDGQAYASLVISLSALRKVIDGERAVTTVSQLIFE